MKHEVTPTQLKIGQKFKAERKRQKLTISNLEGKTGTKPGYVSRLENGKHNPKLSTLILFSNTLKINLKTIFENL